MHWDVYVRVIDNQGDIGVGWRLASDLAARGETVRLMVDDAQALAWMAPHGAPGVAVLPFDDASGEPGDVVIEAFGCELPAAVLDAMARRRVPPAWINLEYLSAEPYVARSHGLPSPVAADRGLGKWFFFPGFDEDAGGLLREPGLLARRDRHDGRAWLAARGWAAHEGERVASLFCYDAAPLRGWQSWLAAQPTLLLLTPGPAAELAAAHWLPSTTRTIALPWLPQPAYDELLWSCDLNFVRGEDSFVRAQWAARPFVWQIYRQHDGVHAAKLEAFVDRLARVADPADAAALRGVFRHWNALADAPPDWPSAAAWGRACRGWADRQAQVPDLVTQLQAFVRRHAGPAC